MKRTPSQTVGPFLALGLPWDDGPVADPSGVTITGLVLDGEGASVPDALVETWSAEPRAFARSATDDDGRWSVTVPAPDDHLAVNVFARGLLHRLVTRVYLTGTPAEVPEDRRHTLMATPTGDRSYAFDIRLQGEDETVFFDV